MSSDAPDLTASEEFLEHLEQKEELAHAWQQLFATKHGRAVIEDLRRCCRPEKSSYSESPYATHVRIGHQEVWHYILWRLGLTHEQVYERLARARVEEER